MQNLILAAVVSCLSALLITPLVRSFALRLGLVDAPDGFRKLHARQVPLGGGLAIMLACALTVIIAVAAGAAWAMNIRHYPQITFGVAGGALLIGVIGLLDDRYRIRGRQKLLGQIAAGLLAVAGGLVVEKVGIFSWEIELGVLAVPFTLCWLIGAINALNLIDGVDGLATSVAIVMCTTLCVLTTQMEHFGEAAVLATLAGALVGFLPYNWRPAKIFMGDAGSMFIGYMLGVMAIRGNLKGPTTVALVAPAAIWAIPMFDVVIAMLRRKLTGQSLYATDRSHLHHVLQRRGWGHGGTALVIAGLCLVCNLGVIASVYFKHEPTAAITVGGVLAMMIVTRCFGHAECHLLARKCAGFLNSLLRLPHDAGRNGQLLSRFHGNREFEQAWQALVEFAERFNLSSVNFNVNAAMLGEVFHAQWKNRADGSGSRNWVSEVPIIWSGHEVGRLCIQGEVPGGFSPFSWSGELMEALRPFERIVLDLLGDEPSSGNDWHAPTPAEIGNSSEFPEEVVVLSARVSQDQSDTAEFAVRGQTTPPDGLPVISQESPEMRLLA